MTEDETERGTGEKAPDTPDDESMTLEQRLLRLDRIVAALEGGEIELEEGLALFEEGVRHIREAEGLLSRAEFRVEELVGAVHELETRTLRGEEES